MKVLVISDSHGNITNLKHVMGFGKKINIDAVIHCGDWDDLESVKTVSSFNISLYTVLGNADVDLLFKFKEFLEIELGGKKIGIAHRIQDLQRKNQDILFCGHTHKQYKNGNIVNPGALENDINFAVYDTDTNETELIHEQI